MPKVIKIRFQNGINGKIARDEILNSLADEFVFDESGEPDFILFGPYGIELPKPGKYTRIGYFCENIRPDLSICEWAFGCMPEETINNPRYKRIQWHRLDPKSLIKPDNYDAEGIFESKKYFCNFLYSHKVPYREKFFKQLSKYKKIDAPGKSMNNMLSIESLYKGDKWEIKKQFLSPYKFTIAFENYVYPGYQTEKLYDPMQSDSLPIYCGDPLIGNIFNTKSFINTADHLKTSHSILVEWLEEHSQLEFIDILPQYYHNPLHRIKRKLKAIGKQAKMRYQFEKLDFSKVIDRIVELDEDYKKYIEVLRNPWFNNNRPPVAASLEDRWKEIFNSVR